MVGCRSDGCAASIDRSSTSSWDPSRGCHRGRTRRNGCRKTYSMRARRARRETTRDAIDARRECTRRCVILYATSDARSRLWNLTTRHDHGRDARRARPTRESNETFSPPSDRVRARRLPPFRASRLASNAPPVASRHPRTGVPSVLFRVATSENFCARRRVPDAIDGASRGLPRGCAHASRAGHEPRVSRYDCAIASTTIIPRRSATRRRRIRDADADATRVESRG